MNWSDYEAVWKRQPLPVGETADLATLRDSFETKRRKMAAALWVRDWIEILACVLGVVTYGCFWRKVGVDGWPMAFAILLVIGVAAKFGHERWRSRRLRVSADASLLVKIEADIAELRHQRRLLLNVWSWYLAPCAGAIAIHGYVIHTQAKPWDFIRQPMGGVTAVVLLGVLLWGVGELNRRTVRKRIEPGLAELEKLRREAVASPEA